MKIETFLSGFQKSLEIDDDTLSVETNIEDLDEWDSMTALMLISFVSEKFDVVLDVDDVLELTTIQSLIERIGIDKFEF